MTSFVVVCPHAKHAGNKQLLHYNEVYVKAALIVHYKCDGCYYCKHCCLSSNTNRQMLPLICSFSYT